MLEEVRTTGLTRRSFLKSSALAAAGVSAITVLGTNTFPSFVNADQEEPSLQTYNCVCRSNCNFSCRYTAHVYGGKLTKLEVADYPDPGYTGSCLKGISYLERIYGPNRIKYPMRRVGERGADQWERITWDEAIDEVSSKLKQIVTDNGPKSLVFDACSGCYGIVNGIYNPLGRLAGVLGATKPAVCYDYAAGHGINRVLGTGDWFYNNEPNSVLDSSLIVVWGTNPVFTAPQNWRWMQMAKEQGTKIITLDPIKSATAYRSNEYIQVKPGNDGYLALAMSNYLIETDMIDKDFLAEKSTSAFLVRKDTKKHLRKSDFTKLKTDDKGVVTEKDDFYVWDLAIDSIALISEAQEPAMEGSFTYEGIRLDTAYSLLKAELQQYSISKASELCGVPEDKIMSFAKEFASSRAVSVYITYGLDHYVNGYLTTWAIATFLALTGNFAKPGAGFVGVFTQTYSPDVVAAWAGTPEYKGANSQVPGGLLHEIFETQQLEGQPYPMKAIISYSSNAISNFAGQNNFFNKILPNLEYWVVLDIEMGDSARYADMVLPVASWYEEEEIRNAYCNPYTIFQDKAIDPLYESKPDYEIACEIGRAMGFEKSFPKDYGFEDWANMFLSNDASKELNLTVERLRKEKVIQTTGSLGDRLVRGLTAPFPSESGRVQLYCENPTPRLNYGQDLSDREPNEHIVYYRPPNEATPDNSLFEKYPLIFLQEHSRFRVHSQWFDTPILKELDPEPLVKINGKDAQERGVKSGDIVEVFNDRGHAVLKCSIDESIAPGIVSIPKGWQRHQFIDGCFQEMTNPTMDPYASAFSYYDTLVDFKKI